MFAVIKTGGRQYRVVPDDVLEIGKIAGDVGTIVQLGEVLLVGGESPVLGVPTVAGASVAAEVLQHKRGPKVISFKKRRRKNSRRKRDEITVLRITEILTNDNKPTIGPRPKREKPVVAAPVDGDDDAPAPAKKKAAAKKPAAKPAAKPRAKPDSKKAAPKKATAKKSDKK
jgi:large subunit ribosomal protein L21